MASIISVVGETALACHDAGQHVVVVMVVRMQPRRFVCGFIDARIEAVLTRGQQRRVSNAKMERVCCLWRTWKRKWLQCSSSLGPD